MAVIVKRVSKEKKLTYQCKIRMKGHESFKTFLNEKDAQTYAFYKERLINNMENFEVPLEERITLKSIFEMKADSIDSANIRGKRDIMGSFERINQFLGNKLFVQQITYKDWEKAFEEISKMEVYMGGKSDKSKRLISTKTIRNIFAFSSSCFSYAISKGINIENHPLKIIQTKLNSILDSPK